ncbi:MAG: hypothetical protein NT099_07460 [Candidatus Saganbacteria bacterium]|nr:hypothetical protein [Candidatus Saganbacteria bacterium]
MKNKIVGLLAILVVIVVFFQSQVFAASLSVVVNKKASPKLGPVPFGNQIIYLLSKESNKLILVDSAQTNGLGLAVFNVQPNSVKNLIGITLPALVDKKSGVVQGFYPASFQLGKTNVIFLDNYLQFDIGPALVDAQLVGISKMGTNASQKAASSSKSNQDANKKMNESDSGTNGDSTFKILPAYNEKKRGN